MTRNAPLPPEASWPDQIAAVSKVQRRIRAARHAQFVLDTFEQRELDRLIRQKGVMPGDGAIALALVRTLFDRRGDSNYLYRVGETLRSVASQTSRALDADQTVTPDVIAVERLDGVGKTVDMVGEVAQFGVELLKSEASDDGDAVGRDTGDRKPGAERRGEATFDIDHGGFPDTPGATVSIAGDDLDTRAADLGEAPAERALRRSECHPNLSCGLQPGDDAESSAGGTSPTTKRRESKA